MKKCVIAALGVVLALSIVACSSAPESQEGDVQGGQEAGTTITQSPDKYTWYIKDYVGMNAASVGYEAIDGFRHDAYGNGNIKLIYVAADGTYIDPGNEEQLKEYVVTGQNIAPNTEMKYEYEVDSEGEEYENLVNFQTIGEVVLSVRKVGESGSSSVALTEIMPSPDRYTHYVRDYVGRNLAECGYYSISGRLTDAYGHGYVFFDVVADDGSYIDAGDEAQLAGYMVTSQSVEPNTAIQMTYSKDSEGNEYSNLIESQSIETITLNVTKAPESGYPVGSDSSASSVEGEADVADAQASETSSADASSADFRALMDDYEAFMNEYVDFMIAYNGSGDTSSMLAEYADMMARYGDMAEQIDDIDEGSLSAGDYAYYMEVMGRVTARLSEVGQ